MSTKFVDNAQQCFAFTPQANFPANSLNFTEGESDGIKSRLPFKIFSTLTKRHILNYCFKIQRLLDTVQTIQNDMKSRNT